MRCLTTRTTREGFRRRRYEPAAGERFSTIEVPLELWNSIRGQGRGRDRVAAWLRERERESRRRQAVALRRNGWTCRDIAQQLGVPLRTVVRWVRVCTQPAETVDTTQGHQPC